MIKPLTILPGLVGVLAALAGVAAASTFEDAAKSARRVRDVIDVVWPLTATCDQGDDVQQRQCRAIRDAAARALAGATLLVDAEPGVLELGTWNPAKKSVSVLLTSCVSCRGVVIDGRTWHVTGAPPRVEGGKLATVPLHDNAKQFADEAAAKAWLRSLADARVQLVVKVPDKRRWQVGGKDGLALDVLGYRVISPCSGAAVISSPASGSVPPDPTACTGAQATLVPALTAELVRAAMKPVIDAADACFAQYKVAGKARLELTIADDGSVVAYDRTGDFKESPTGLCIDNAMRTVAFPPTQKPRTKIGYPIVLQ